MINYLEKFIKSKDEVKAIEEKLHDYENLPELIDINKTIFNFLTEKIDDILDKYKLKINSKKNNTSTEFVLGNNSESDYEKLEKLVQKYENDIRNHIGVIFDNLFNFTFYEKYIFYLIKIVFFLYLFFYFFEIEQQLRLYAESIQNNFEDSEKTKKDIQDSNKVVIAVINF